MITLKQYLAERVSFMNRNTSDFSKNDYSYYRDNEHIEWELTKDEERYLAAKSTINKKIDYKHNDGRIISIYPTIHGAAMAFIRRPEFGINDWKKLHVSSIRWIWANNKPDGHYLFFSKSADQGYVIEFKGKGNKHQFRIVTVLPEGKNRPSNKQNKTTQVIVEGVEIVAEFVDLD